MSILKSAGVAKSIDDLRRTAAGGGRTGRSAQLFLGADSSVKVRFLQEPLQFMEYLEHYDQEKKKFVPAIDNDPMDNHPDERARKTSRRWVVNVLNLEDGKVHIVKINPDQMSRLLNRYTRNNTLMDRNYELIRNGAGRDSKYDIDSDDPTQMDLSRHVTRLHDLEEFLLSEVDEYHGTTFAEDYRKARERMATENGQATPAADPSPPPVDPGAAQAQAAATKIAELDEKYGADPPFAADDQGDTQPHARVDGGEAPPPAPGMAEIAAQTEASAQAVSTPPLTAVPDPEPAGEVDPWVLAKQNGQPCSKGENGLCVICGFEVTECLMAK